VCVFRFRNSKKNKTVFATATAGGVSLGPGSGRGYLRSLRVSGFGMIAPVRTVKCIFVCICTCIFIFICGSYAH
jgi:hypothetical protein